MFDFKSFNHMDRIILCGRRDEDPGHLFKSANWFFPRLWWSFVYPTWIHICMVMAMLKFSSVWHRSTLYVQYVCPILSPLSHWSTLYSSSHAFLFLSWICLVLVYNHELVTFVYDSKVLMHYKCLLDDILWPSWHFQLEVTTCSLKALTYHIPLSLMLWGHSFIPKSYHHHVIRPLTFMFALNPSI